MVLCVLPHMINNYRRWSLSAILGSVVLLVTGTGLFLIAPSRRGTTTGLVPDAARGQPAVERLE